MRAPGPAFESLPRREPRGGRALLGRERVADGSRAKRQCPATVSLGGGNRRRRRFSITELRGCVAFAVVG